MHRRFSWDALNVTNDTSCGDTHRTAQRGHSVNWAAQLSQAHRWAHTKNNMTRDLSRQTTHNKRSSSSSLLPGEAVVATLGNSQVRIERCRSFAARLRCLRRAFVGTNYHFVPTKARRRRVSLVRERTSGLRSYASLRMYLRTGLGLDQRTPPWGLAETATRPRKLLLCFKLRGSNLRARVRVSFQDRGRAAKLKKISHSAGPYTVVQTKAVLLTRRQGTSCKLLLLLLLLTAFRCHVQ